MVYKYYIVLGEGANVGQMPESGITGLRVCGLSNLFENEIESLRTVNLSP